MIDAGLSRNLVDTLLEIHSNRRSGILRFEKSKAKKQLVVDGGNLAYAESNLSDEHLALVMVRTHRFPRAELATVTALMKEGKTTHEALLATQKIETSTLIEGARELSVIIVSTLFAWDDCEVRLYQGDNRSRRHLNIAMPLTELLVLASRRAAKERLLPPALLKLEGLVTQATGEPEGRLSLPLDNLEGMVYATAREPIPVDNFLGIVPPGTENPEELLLRLLLLGLLRLTAPTKEAMRSYYGTSHAHARQGLALRVEELLSRFEVADHYEILSVPPDATEEQIKNSYHDLAREFHPDRFQSEDYSPQLRREVEKLFTYITGAYTILSSSASRESYDEKRLKEGSKVDAVRQARSGVTRETEKMTEALCHSAKNMISRGEYEQAVNLLKECVWSRPDVPRYRHFLGLAQLEVPRFRKEAEQHLLKAIELDPMRLDSRLALGKLYIKVNLPRRAEAQFLEVLRWDPDHPEANKLLAMLPKNR